MTEVNHQRPSWDEYFINIMEMIGSRATCDRGRSGCVITKEKRIISSGYVGSPINTPHCDEIGHEMATMINSEGKESKHCIRTTHAEQNAICQAARAGISLKGATLYCKMTPCYTCAKMIINSGIVRVVCASDYHAGSRSKEIFAQAGVEFELLNDEMMTYPEMGAEEHSHEAVIEDKNIPELAPAPAPVMTREPELSQPEDLIRTSNIADIFIYDEFSPEDTAMMQALYSRSPESVVNHAEKVRQTGSGKFMEKFYVGYGHASIADCGSTTLFIENISILADKALQDWPLYSGQETSTRYVDMSKRAIIDPLHLPVSEEIIARWMKFYLDNQETVGNHLRELYQRREDEPEAMYDKAIKARAFDITRGFLPAGITTQLSWHTNLRQAWDKISQLVHHPLDEVREIGENMLTKLKSKYPHSFSHVKNDDQEMFRAMINAGFNYFDPENHPSKMNLNTSIKVSELNQYKEIFQNRPPKTGLPHFLTELGLLTFDFQLDFGSFRDLQRHRNSVCRMPLLTTKHGFHEWYLSQLPGSVRFQAETLIEQQTAAIGALPTNDETRQYYIALGYKVPCRVSYGLPAALYVAELRSGKAVHPTLRQIAHQMCDTLTDNFPQLKLHADLEKDDWDARRGLQDITVKE
jgi:deoxycytidylate deaminase/thymidylate synthase ThyX